MTDEQTAAGPVLVLGAGVSGLVAAHVLATQGSRAIVIETRDRLGGNQISRNIGPYTFDIGSFIFFPGSAFFRRFPAAEATCVEASFQVLRITPQARLASYPYDLKTDLLGRGPIEIARTLLSVLSARLAGLRKSSAEAYARYYLGNRLLTQSGLRFYIQLLCGLPAGDVEYVFAEKRMSWIERALQPSALFRGLSRWSRPRRSAPPVATLARPREGFDALFAPVRVQLEAQGVAFRLGAALASINPVGSGFEVVCDADRLVASRVISTFPLDITAGLLGLQEAAPLPALPLLTLYVALTGDPGFGSEVLYNFSGAGAWKRLTMHSRVYGTVEGRHFLSVEVPLGRGAIDPQEAFAAFVDSLRHYTGDATFELVGWDVTENAYPVYGMGATAAADALIDRIEASGIEMVGRQGRFDYIPTANLAAQLAAARVSNAPQRG